MAERLRYHLRACCWRIVDYRIPVRILLSNDDGIDAPGIQALILGLKDQAEIWVAAPDRDRSGASNSLTLDAPIRALEVAPRQFKVYGTPTDCVHLALGGLLDFKPDMVISGINNSANMGDDTLYSGTVAAAMEGRLLGLPAIAVSLVTRNHVGVHYPTAVRTVQWLLARLAEQPLTAPTLLNVNVPDVPFEDLQGFQCTRLGHRHHSEPLVPMHDPRGRRVYWVGPAGPEADAGPGTDFDAVRHMRVSVTPLTTDLTHHQAMGSLNTWMQG
jgi:5'-nucleotidase